jgi:hypothetical protein
MPYLKPTAGPSCHGLWWPGGAVRAECPAIEAHLTIVYAALAASRWIEDRTGRSIRKFVCTARRYRTIEI